MGVMKFDKSHEWINMEDGAAVIGITDYAQKELGDMVFVELPRIGDKLNKDEQFATVESTKAASEVYAPVTGVVIEINAELANNPQWINESPIAKGWMVKVKLDDISQLDELMDEADYNEFISSQSH